MRMQQVILSITLTAFSASGFVAGADTKFTYQGRLLDAGAPASGMFNVDFRLWDDPAAGNQVGSTNTFNSLPILEGLFTVELDFGANAFDNNDRWLEITIDGVPLVPRQPITRTPYAIQTRGINVKSGGYVGIGTDNPFYLLHIQTTDDEVPAVYARNFASTGASIGGEFVSDSTSGVGVKGIVTAPTGVNFGGLFRCTSTTGSGVYSLAAANSGINHGGRFESFSTSGRGAYGVATANTGTTYGGYFQSSSTSGRGVYGIATAQTGTTYGLFGYCPSTSGRAVFGLAAATTGTNYGGRFESDSASGFAGYFDGKGNDAVYVLNTGAGRGLHAVAPSDTAVWAQTTTGFAGVHGANAAASGRGVYGEASASTGTNYGVFGASNSASGYDFYAGGAGVNYGASSSRRWKNNVVPIGDPLDKLARLRGVFFDWDDEHGGGHDVGMIAEEVGAVLPEVVQFEENGIDASGMDYSKMTPLLVEAVNALRAEKDAEIARQQVEIDNMAKRLERMEATMKRLVEK